MSLVLTRPESLPPDASTYRVVTFASPADGQPQQVHVYSPAAMGSEPLPLVIAPHPVTWTSDQDYQGGLEGLKRGHHCGWYGLADAYRVIVAMPHGHHRRVDLCSLGSPEQIEDMAHLLAVLEEQGYPVERHRIYACGLSMGGQEALILAGRYPDVLAAVVAFNPIVDLAAWQEDMAVIQVPEIQEHGIARLIAEEVGGLPRDMPADYAERSVTTYVGGLTRMPTLMFWSEKDLIVPRQTTHHAHRLYEMVKAQSPTSPIAEYNHTLIHGLAAFDETTRWQLHEWCDYELALRWLMLHRRPA